MPGKKIGASRMTAKSQITVPKEVKDIIGVKAGEYVVYMKDGNRVYLVAGDIVSREDIKAPRPND